MSQLTPGNQLTLLRNGTEYFPALLAAIHVAKYEIYLQTYIFKLDQTGERVCCALQQAALRGVCVFLLLDGFGCRNLSKRNIAKLRTAGVEVLFFRPKISPWTLKRSRLRRLHSKLTVVDGVVGFVGGINIVDDFNTPSHTPPRVDYAVKVEGPLLKSMHENAKLIWRQVCRRQLQQTKSSHLDVAYKYSVLGDMRAAFLVRDNFKHRTDIEMAYLRAIKSAKSEIIIANAYFLPGLRFRHALRDAAARGVRIILLLQKHTEYVVLDFATRALYSVLLNQSINIYEYHKSFMHSKVAVIDSQLAIVGSSNIDPFSLLLSFEANVVIESERFATQLKQSLQLSIDDGSTLIRVEEWQHRDYLKRFVSWVAYGLVKLIVGLVGYPENT